MPTNGLRELLQAIRKVGRGVPLVWLSKGFETDGAKLPHEICSEEAPGASRGVLSGPSFADEVARGLPAALTLAFDRCARRGVHRAKAFDRTLTSVFTA